MGEFAADCFAPMLGLGPVAAGRKVQIAAGLAARLPGTLAAMSAGVLDSWRATIIATELAEAGPASCAGVEALTYPVVLGEAPGAVTKRVRAVLARVDDLAHRMRGDDPTRTLEQCPADALVDLMLTNINVATTVTLMIPVQTATVDDFGQPAGDPNPLIEPTWAQIAAMGYEIPGIGVIGGDVVAGILDKFDTRIARVLLDEHTGIVIETRIKDYLPNTAMRRFVQARDGVCTWTDPHQRQYATHPTNHHEMAARRTALRCRRRPGQGRCRESARSGSVRRR